MRDLCNNHKTKDENIIGKIDIYTNHKIEGWMFDYENQKIIEDTRLMIDEKLYPIFYQIKREDVSKYYENKKIENCGFQCVIPNEYQKLMIQYKKDDDWKNIYLFEKPKLEIRKETPQLIIIDDFYENPDEIRNFALQQEFITNIASHKGRRTTLDFNNEIIKKRFEELLGKPIIKWDYKWNGCFQYCIAEDPLVIHCDQQKYAGLIYLKKDAPCTTGTSFYRHKKTKSKYYEEIEFEGGNYDFTPFEMVDTIGNIYNRLVIFDAKMIHAASQYFGKEKEDSRLFQIFFFDI
jgi:hypothetical protein